MALKRDGGERDRDPRDPRVPGAPAPAPGPVVPVVSATPAPTPQTTRPSPQPDQAAPAPPSPEPSAAPADIPSQGPVAPRGPKTAADASNRPGTQASQQALFARAGVRLGAFDPRQRGADERQRGILQALGAGAGPGAGAVYGAGASSVNAAGQALPPNLGFNPREFEDEQRILGALRGA